MKKVDTQNISGKRNEGGYTLLEVLMAISIFMVGLLAIGSMQTRALLGNATSRDITEAVNVAIRTAEDLMSINWDTSDKDVRLDPDAGSGDYDLTFDTEHEQYNVNIDPDYVDAGTYGSEKAIKITITVSWPRGLAVADRQSITYELFRTESI